MINSDFFTTVFSAGFSPMVLTQGQLTLPPTLFPHRMNNGQCLEPLMDVTLGLFSDNQWVEAREAGR